MSAQSNPPLLSKKYLYVLPVVILLVAWNLLFNPDARKLVGLKQGSSLPSLSDWFKHKKGGGAAPQAKPPVFSAEEMKAFTDSFTQREVKDICIPAPVVDKPSELAVQDKKQQEEQDRKKREQEAEQKKIASLWPAGVQGVYKDMKGQWTAIISGKNVHTGNRLTLGRNDLCDYSLLALGQRCAWMQVLLPGDATSVSLPDIEWPDVKLVELARVNGKYEPTGVILGSGDKLKEKEALEYKTTGARFTVKKLWLNGVVFEAIKGGAHVMIACMLVSQ